MWVSISSLCCYSEKVKKSRLLTATQIKLASDQQDC